MVKCSTSNGKREKSIRLDEIHWKLINRLTPFYGSTEAEVIRNIVLMWLHQNLGSETIKKLEEMGAIQTNRDLREEVR